MYVYATISACYIHTPTYVYIYYLLLLNIVTRSTNPIKLHDMVSNTSILS